MSSEFIYEKTGESFLTSKPLQSLWRGLEDEVKERHRYATYEILELTEMVARENIYRKQIYRDFWTLSREQSLSIQLLHEAFIYSGGSLSTKTGRGLMSDLPEKRMQLALWCPSEIAVAQHRFSVTGRYYASCLKRLRPPLSHSSCTYTKCYASQVDKSTYVTQPACGGCQYGHVAVDLDKPSPIVERGQILFEIYLPP